MNVDSHAAASAEAKGVPRERLFLDFGWKFHLGNDWGPDENLAKAGSSGGPANLNFNDTSWRTVNVPHDWAVELPFDSKANYDHGYKAVGDGFPANNVGWYRRTFTLTKEDRDRRLWLEFDGVYRDCRIFLNGFRLAHHENGYNSFRCDITDVARTGGTNILAVRVDASEYEGWFYEGAGIYRHVWLVETAPLAIAPDGVFVHSSFKNNVPAGSSTIHLETRLLNAQNHSVNALVSWQVISPEGKMVGEARKLDSVEPQGTVADQEEVEVTSPMLWSPESPKLYKLVTYVSSGGEMVDRVETKFGIRTLGWDTTNGFLLNGRRYAIKGTCDHQDHAGVGVALPDALQYFRVAKLKEMGCNAIRTSHNEPTAELLDACDELGILVMDENRLLGSDDQNLAMLEQQIRRDRNHPCVFVWSLANEEHSYQQSETGARIFETMQNLAHKLDPTRLCTAAMDGRSQGKADGFSRVMDVQGFNYIHRGDMDKFHRANPAIPCIGTEEASAYYTRGVYENSSNYKSAYEGNKPDYGTTAEEWWNYYVERPWASGSFVWTGFDYRGEASPFRWPNISSEFGILDVCGFPKDVYYYYQSWWTDQPVLHLMPHWNWPGKEGQNIDVRCFSNCEEVELYLNGQSLGRKSLPKYSHLQWLVPYAPGTLSARGFAGGKLLVEQKIETTGAPAGVKLTPDRVRIKADGKDLSIITVAVTDSQGRVVPLADNLVQFKLLGPGRILGGGNGNPICHEPDVCGTEPTLRLVPLADWRMKKTPDAKNRPETGELFDDKNWEPVDVNTSSGPLQAGEAAVYRTCFTATPQDLSAIVARINIGMIDDNGRVYLNGEFVGESHDWSLDPRFEVRKFLHAGTNTLAVVVKNDDGQGGLNKGVTLEFEDEQTSANWQRSVFNGLAQVIIQSDGTPGEIKLSATGRGLNQATAIIQTETQSVGEQP